MHAKVAPKNELVSKLLAHTPSRAPCAKVTSNNALCLAFIALMEK